VSWRQASCPSSPLKSTVTYQPVARDGSFPGSEPETRSPATATGPSSSR
jgi:hypothetical protein